MRSHSARAAASGTYVDNATRKTCYRVIGSAGATKSWKQDSYGLKFDAAMKLKEQGHPIQIVTGEV